MSELQCDTVTPIPGSENVWPQKAWYTHVHGSVIHNSLKVEAIHFHQLMNSFLKMWYISIQKTTVEWKWGSDPCYNMDNPWKHYTLCKKLVIKDHIPYDSTSLKCPRQANSQRWTADQWLPVIWSDYRSRVTFGEMKTPKLDNGDFQTTLWIF